MIALAHRIVTLDLSWRQCPRRKTRILSHQTFEGSGLLNLPAV